MNLFNRTSSKPAGFSSEPQLTLGAFGKHPGWDDHIPGIGLETEFLVYVEKTLYAGGIRGQIDAGAWAPEKLGADKRLEGFDHIFLWLRPGHVLLGQLWSSTDGKGRLNYPMVLAIDGESVSPAFMLGILRPGLDKLREACLAATTAEKVISNCRSAQDQLRAMLSEPAARLSASPPPLEARRKFLERPELGPSRQGLLRILHELSSIPGFAINLPKTGTSPIVALKSRHLRLPLTADSRSQSLLLWTAFLQVALADSLPLLFLTRRDAPFIDLIVGEAVPDDFFCFQAAPAALPLVTEIPYEISAALQAVLPQLEARFLSDDPLSPGVALAAAAKMAPIATPATAQPTPATSYPAEPAVAAPAKGRKRWLFFGILVLVAAAVAVGWYFLAGPSPPRTGEPGTVATAPPSEPKASQPQPNQKEADFKDALAKARDALAHQDYSNAIVQAEAALALKPNDPSASQLRTQAQRDLDVATQALAQQQKYESALAQAQSAFSQKDFAKALTQADLALSFRSNDAAALKLRTDAQHELDLAAQAKARQQKFDEALKAGREALARNDYDETIKRAQSALAIQNVPDAAILLDQANQAKAALARAAAMVNSNSPPAADTAVAATTSTTSATPTAKTDRFTNTIGMAFVWLPSLGSSGAYLGVTEVSKKEFRAIMGKPDITPGQDDFPVMDVSFADAQQFCERLSQRENKKYSLPTTNDWLAVVGLTAAQVSEAWKILSANASFKNEVTSLESRRSGPAPVGSRGPQANGLCDLLGNVREWTADGQSAGFSYNSLPGRTKQLFLTESSEEPWIKPATGLRCLLQQ